MTTIPDVYRYPHLEAHKQFFKLFGGAFRLYAPDGRLVAFSRQKAFKLREDIRVYSDEAESQQILSIQADRIIDFSAAYQVYDNTTGEHVGTLRRKGWSSLFRDSWEILDHHGLVRGRVREESGWKAFFRRLNELFSLLMPQCYLVEVDGRQVARMQQHFAFFVRRFSIDLTEDLDGALPRQLAIAMVVLLLAIEGSQGADL